MKYIIIIASALCCMAACSGCEKIWGEKGYEYQILKSGSPNGLVFFLCTTSSDIVGIDTTTFTVEAWVRMKNMSIGGVAKLPQGGIAFTHHRRISDNAWGNTLYVTDDSYNIIGTYPICLSPMAPKVIGNTLMVGSSGLEDNLRYKFQLYDTETFQLKKEFLLEDMADAWQISEYGNYAYIGVDVNIPLTHNSYVAQVDLNTLSMTTLFNNTSFFNSFTYHCARKDNLLYVFSVVGKDLCIIDLSTNTIGNVVKTSQYPEIAAKNADHLIFPRVTGDYLYAFLGTRVGEGQYLPYRLKFNTSNFALEDIKRLDIPGGYTNGGYTFFAGRFLVIGVEVEAGEIGQYVVFIDVESGEIVNTVKAL
jgi:hypothetical protein